MKLNQLLTKTEYNTVVAGADVTISYKDGLFLYHALNKISENMRKAQEEVGQMTDNIEPNATLRDTCLILESMHQLLMPIATEIVIPKQGIDIYAYNSAEEATINLKKKSFKHNYDDVVAAVENH